MSVYTLSKEELNTAGMRHAFDLLGMWTAHSGAQTVSLDENDPVCIELLRLRLSHGVNLVEGTADMHLCLFHLPVDTGGSHHLAGCVYNAGSYQRLLRPALPVCSVKQLRRSLASLGYRIESLAGIYPPAFLFWWLMGMLAGAHFSPQYFQWNKRTEETIATANPSTLPFCHLLVYHAQHES